MAYTQITTEKNNRAELTQMMPESRAARKILEMTGKKHWATTLAMLLVMNNAVNLAGVAWIGAFLQDEMIEVLDGQGNVALDANGQPTTEKGDGKELLQTIWTVIPVLIIGEIAAKLLADWKPIAVARRGYWLIRFCYCCFGWIGFDLVRGVTLFIPVEFK